MSKKAGLIKIPCVQIQLGTNKFKFKDVEVKSTSLNNIIKEVINRSEKEGYEEDKVQLQAMKDLLNSGSTFSDINTMITSGESNTDIADFSVGNTTARGLFTLSYLTNTNSSYIDRLSSINFGSNILITSNSKNTGYIGKSRVFLTLNSSILDDNLKLSQALSFSHIASTMNKEDSPIKEVMKKGIKELQKIQDQPVGEFLNYFTSLDENNKYKQLLTVLPLYKNNENIKKYILYPLAKYVYSKVGDVKLDPKYSIKSTSLLSASILAKNTLKGKKVTINGNYYDIPFILQTFNKVKEFEDNKIQIKPELEGLNISEQLAKYISSLQSDSSAYRLMMDIVNNEDIEIKNCLYDEEGNPNTTSKALNNVLSKLFIHEVDDIFEDLKSKERKKLVSEVIDNTLESFFPLMDNINFDADISNDTRIKVSTINSEFNKDYKNYSKSFQFEISNSSGSFVTIEGDIKKSQVLKVLINPNKDYTEKDRDALRKAITQVNGKSVRNQLFVTKQKGVYEKGKALDKLTSLFEDLITNNKYINSVNVAGTDDFGLDIIKAAASNKIKTALYPNYYLSNNYNKSELYKYLDSELNLNFSSNPSVYVSEAEDFDKLTNTTNYFPIRNSYSMVQSKVGDVIKVKNSINGQEVKKVITKKIDFSFHPDYSSPIFSSVSNDFLNGSVVSYNRNGEVGDYLIIQTIGDQYQIKNLSKSKESPITISKSELLSKGIPLYKSDERQIGDNIYYRHINGIFRLNTNDGIYKYEGPELWREYYQEELEEIYNNSQSNYSLEDFIALNFPTSSSFNGKDRNAFIKTEPYQEETINKYNPVPDTYNNQGMVELIIGSMRRSGIKVKFMDSKDIKDLGITTNPKAFIHNGEIILNKDKYTEDSPIHELMHLLLGQLKVNDPSLYNSMLEGIEEFEEYNQLRQIYPELTQNDFAEEVLVHVLTNQLMGKIYDAKKELSSKFDLKRLVSEVFKINQEGIREFDNQELMNKNLSTLLIDNNSSILEDLLNLTKMPEILINNQISNMKSKLLEEGKLTEDCK